jgi:hypothetical protein
MSVVVSADMLPENRTVNLEVFLIFGMRRLIIIYYKIHGWRR